MNQQDYINVLCKANAPPPCKPPHRDFFRCDCHTQGGDVSVRCGREGIGISLRLPLSNPGGKPFEHR